MNLTSYGPLKRLGALLFPPSPLPSPPNTNTTTWIGQVILEHYEDLITYSKKTLFHIVFLCPQVRKWVAQPTIQETSMKNACLT